ncbi:MAG: hypothetical protein ACI9IP_001907 [Arcticibacterium sp.]|jgi:hypothetical protein
MEKSNALITLVTFIFLMSCNKTVVNPAQIVNKEELIAAQEDGNLLYEGKFKDGAHPTSGTATIIDLEGVKKLNLVNFKTDNGPDVRVYLAEDLRAKNFIEISKDVQNGTVTYNIPAEADLDKQKYVLIWCKLFKVNFGSAELQKPTI